jgi:hypothetical protein
VGDEKITAIAASVDSRRRRIERCPFCAKAPFLKLLYAQWRPVGAGQFLCGQIQSADIFRHMIIPILAASP